MILSVCRSKDVNRTVFVIQFFKICGVGGTLDPNGTRTLSAKI